MKILKVAGWLVWFLGLVALLTALFLPKGILWPTTAVEKAVVPQVIGTNASINNLWVTVSLILVFLMQPGFAFLESGLARSGNTINVLFKNTLDFCLNSIAFLYLGYALMWHGSASFWQFHGSFELGWLPTTFKPNGIVPPIHFLFQMVFATTAATICSGMVQGRIKVIPYFIITVFISSLIYPIAGHWAWCADENGSIGFLLQKLNYHDFAGSSVVHVVGGLSGLAGAIVLGPRLGRYKGDSKLSDLRKQYRDAHPPLAGLAQYGQSIHKSHNFSSAALGTFLLWVGWFGFNGGSVLAMSDGAEKAVGIVIINTMLAGCAGGISGALAPFLANALRRLKSAQPGTKAFFSFEGALNGIIGGLVAITASCDIIDKPLYAVVVGLVAGVFVHYGSLALNKFPAGWKVDDPVGAFPVHGICGILGILVCPFFSDKYTFFNQTFGLSIIVVWSFSVSFLVYWTIDFFGVLRSTPEDEVLGLDVVYHGQTAYTIETYQNEYRDRRET